LVANFSKFGKLGSLAPGLYNFAVTAPVISTFIKWFSGFAVKRSMPTLYKTTLLSWYKKEIQHSTLNIQNPKKVYLFCDEFTNYNDTEIGMKAILLLQKLGYEVEIPEHTESGRAWMSKGLIREAKKIANKNIDLLSSVINSDRPLLGIEPSAIFSFRDEYVDLADDDKLEKAKELAKNVFLIDEFIAGEIEKGYISKTQFTQEKKLIKLHGHCQQKSISSVGPSVKMLSLPENYTVETIPSGCCGMAGSFGFEKEHYDLSIQIGELVLFPTVRQQSDDVIIAAPGTSCRHQIKDGTKRTALHPVEIMYEALVK
jgi:Fe-S oxidoreductase